jgi:acyl dehydratase
MEQMGSIDRNGLSYDELEIGVPLGTGNYQLDQSLLDEWGAIHGITWQPGAPIQGGLVFVFGLRTLMDLKIIPPGGVLAAHDLRFFTPLGLGTQMDIVLTCTDKTARKGLPFATLQLDLTVQGQLVMRDDMRVLWPGDTPVPLPKRQQLPPGDDYKSHPLVIEQDAVSRYADLSHDHNPLHLDENFAAQGPFGHLVVHATIPAGHLLDQAAAAAPEKNLARWRCNIKFLSALKPGERFAILPPEDGFKGNWECRSERDSLICIGEVLSIA